MNGAPAFSLGEGNTPLVRSRWIGPHLGLDHLHFKLEQTNPTGSYKDRFAARLISLLLSGGHDVCLGTSSGNAGAAMAAYAAAAGISCVLCVPEGAPAAKLSQIRAYGARLLRVRGMVDSGAALRALFDRLRAIAGARSMPLGVSAYALSPEAMAGIEPLGGELVAQLGAVPDRVFVPVGGGGLLVATWEGLRKMSGGAPTSAGSRNRAEIGARMHAVQAAGNDTLAGAFRAGEARAREVTTPARISGLVVPIDLDATRALQAVRRSGGGAHLVEDERVWEVQALLARREGLYVEPAGAVSVAGLWRAAEEGLVGPRERVVCLLTGHGFKDEGAARRMAERAASEHAEHSGGASFAEDAVIPSEAIDEAFLERLLRQGRQAGESGGER